MKNKKLTDEEIVKAYTNCASSSDTCAGCPYRLDKNRCQIKRLNLDVLDLIHRLQGENERLTKLAELRKKDNEETCELLFEAEKQVDEYRSTEKNYEK